MLEMSDPLVFIKRDNGLLHDLHVSLAPVSFRQPKEVVTW